MDISTLWPKIFELLTQIVGLVLLAFLPIVAHAAVKYLYARADNFTSDKTHDTQWIVDSAAVFIVQAAEQLGRNGKLVDGQAKLDWAVNYLQSYLLARGISLPLKDLEMAVEAAVYDEINRHKPSPPKPEPAPLPFK